VHRPADPSAALPRKSHALLDQPPRKKPLANATGISVRFNPLAEPLYFATSLAHVGIDGITVTEIIRNHRVHIGELERRIAKDDFFRRLAGVIGVDDRVQWNTRVCQQDDSVFT
jgi:hypothetical protein